MGLLTSILPPVLQPGSISLVLGTVTFQYLELPETIGPLGSHLAMSTHDYPGGQRTVQTFGSFPEEFSWHGILTGSTALSRSLQLQRLAAVGQSVLMSYGTFAYLGYVQKYHANPKHQWHIPYEITFMPQQDLSGSIVALLAAAGLAPEVALAEQLGLLSNPVLNIPIGMQSPVAALLTTTSNALTSAGGKVAAISPSDATLISSSIGAVLSAAGPYVSALPSAASLFRANNMSIDAIDESAALDIVNYAIAIGIIVDLAVNGGTSTTLNVINPNLMALAAQYYSDATQWRLIANANGLSDPQPIGEFNLVIPSYSGNFT